MNAVTSTLGKPSKPGAFKWLIKREFWENRGGFFWAPVITGGIAALFAIVATVIATLIGAKHGSNWKADSNDLAEAARAAGVVGDGSLLVGIGLSMAILAFVVFFYSLGSLYDDRRDRSVLFWKSLPISDTHMVLSKLAWALLLAPLLALGVGVLIGLSFWLIAAIAAMANGLPGGSGLLTHSHTMRIIGNVLAALPVQILWSLPAVGWLMLCSAWAKRLPFLWAVLLPFLTCAMVGLVAAVFHIAADIDLPYVTFLYVVLYRGLASIIPGIWLPVLSQDARPDDVLANLDVNHTWQAFATADLWIGAAVGVVMIIGAIYLRRWRESE